MLKNTPPPLAIEITLGQSLGPRGAKSLLWQILRSEGGVFPMACIPTRNSPLTFSFPGSVWKNIIPETYRKITIGRLLSNDNVKFNLSLSGKKYIKEPCLVIMFIKWLNVLSIWSWPFDLFSQRSFLGPQSFGIKVFVSSDFFVFFLHRLKACSLSHETFLSPYCGWPK